MIKSNYFIKITKNLNSTAAAAFLASPAAGYINGINIPVVVAVPEVCRLSLGI